ncbi:MAG: polyprenyl synthetase family protein [Bacteroidetes bacterium]|nr:polyprenyl synthetase family protein [Bacteroidota bacterium]
MKSIGELHILFQQELGKYKFLSEPVELYAPINYILESGGKRIRPLFTLLSCELVGGDYAKAINQAVAIEIFHNFTLMHDDIMDSAPLRRGKESIHIKWNINTAILSGDAMLIEAYKALCRCDQKVLPDVINIFSKMAGEVCEGQQFDINYESKESVTVKEYINMIRLKTAALLAASMKIGATLGGATTETCNNAFEIGENLGIAFQLQDDLLDLFSDDLKFGKQVGGDVIAQKKTILYLKALELSEDPTGLHKTFTSEDLSDKNKIDKIKKIYLKLGIPEIVKSEVNSYYSKASELLDRLDTSPESKKSFREFVGELMNRKF